MSNQEMEVIQCEPDISYLLEGWREDEDNSDGMLYFQSR